MSQDEYIEDHPATRQDTKRTLLTISIILNIAMAMGVGLLYHQNNTLEQDVANYIQTLSTTSEKIVIYKQQINITKAELLYYKNLANQLSTVYAANNDSPSVIGRAIVPIVSVKTVKNAFSVGYEGEILQADIELVHGEGRVLVDTKIINGADIQSSLRTAADVASQLTDVSLSGTDIILTIEGGNDAEIVDGPSAGGALTIALYSAITSLEPLSDIYMTGTITSDGTVGPIGGLEYKGIAVGEAGGKVFLVPRGQSTIVTYRQVTRTIGRSSFIFYESITVDLESYLAEKGYNVDVVEVSNITEAIHHFFAS